MLTSLQSLNGNHIRAKGGNVLILCLLVNLWLFFIEYEVQVLEMP